MSSQNNNGQNHSGQSHGSVKEYITGLIISLLLTFIPFGLIMFSGLSSNYLMVAIIVCAIAQLIVQGVFFLHMNGDSSQAWNLASALYTIFTVLFFILGSIWIFNHANHNMLMGH